MEVSYSNYFKFTVGIALILFITQFIFSASYIFLDILATFMWNPNADMSNKNFLIDPGYIIFSYLIPIVILWCIVSVSKKFRNWLRKKLGNEPFIVNDQQSEENNPA